MCQTLYIINNVYFLHTTCFKAFISGDGHVHTVTNLNNNADQMTQKEQLHIHYCTKAENFVGTFDYNRMT